MQTSPRNGADLPRASQRIMYTVAEAAAIIGISRSTAYELILRGELAATKLGGRRLVTPATIQNITGVLPPPPSS